MKYFFTFLLLMLAGFTFQAQAQGSCNPAFTSQHIAGMTIKFNPAIITDSPLVQHYWTFGDAGSSWNTYEISPTRTYASPGIYNVKHVIIRRNPNGVLLCADSTTAQVIAQGPCNLTAEISSGSFSTNPLSISFFANITPYVSVESTDSLLWTFGDGTSSTDTYPTHTYATSGTYTACFRVKKITMPPGLRHALLLHASRL